MSFRKEVKNMSNKELIDRISGCSCNSNYRVVWNIMMNELGIRLGAKDKEIEEAIKYFKRGIFYDIFPEEMIKIAKTSLEALERMKDGL
mgnify:CR=1 FL=1